MFWQQQLLVLVLLVLVLLVLVLLLSLLLLASLLLLQQLIQNLLLMCHITPRIRSQLEEDLIACSLTDPGAW